MDYRSLLVTCMLQFLFIKSKKTKYLTLWAVIFWCVANKEVYRMFIFVLIFLKQIFSLKKRIPSKINATRKIERKMPKLSDLRSKIVVPSLNSHFYIFDWYPSIACWKSSSIMHAHFLSIENKMKQKNAENMRVFNKSVSLITEGKSCKHSSHFKHTHIHMGHTGLILCDSFFCFYL